MLTERFEDALAYAARLHREQKRKGSDIPYVAHLLGVASIALENGADQNQAIAALLHDAVEDQGGAPRLVEIREQFGDDVADMVSDCTDADTIPKPPWGPRKEAYVDSLLHKPERSLQVSLADKTHNAGTIVADLLTHGDVVWDRFTGGRDGSLWYYDAVATAFAKRIPGPATDRLIALVSEMHKVFDGGPAAAADLTDNDASKKSGPLAGSLPLVTGPPAKIMEDFEYNGDLKLKCPMCEWEGTPKNGGCIEYHSDLFDVSCPRCDKMLLVVGYPLVVTRFH